MQMTQSATGNPVLGPKLITMEMAGMLVDWSNRDGGIHVLLKIPTRTCDCKEPHVWFVNRDGRTRCCQCDEKYVQARNLAIRQAVGL